MPIEFHCDHCGHHIRASGAHAGKRGTCPHCHQSVYIPTPSDEIEPLRLAPVDESEQREEERLLDESRRLAQTLREDKTDVPPELPKTPLPEPLEDIRLPSDMEALVVEYALAMSQGKLEEAEKMARQIRQNLAQAEEVIQRLTMDELPPTRLAGIPRPVLLKFIARLREPE